MNSLIQFLNHVGETFLDFAGPMLWQSSLLILVLFALDGVLRQRARATMRYALWMLVLVKLLLPTSLSLPTSPVYWIRAPAWLGVPSPVEISHEQQFASQPLRIIESESSQPEAIAGWNIKEPRVQTRTLPAPALSSPLSLIRWPAVIALSWLLSATSLLLVVIHRGRRAWRLIARATEPPPAIGSMVAECAERLGVRSRVCVRYSDAIATPIVCGLLRPVILLPGGLPVQLGSEQLRAVLLHELAHVRRGDLWMSHLQTALQILHFFNPLLWLANARIRRVREEAVDEMVLVALADGAEVYPETLLNLAKRAVKPQPLAFGLIGILESKSSVGQRIRLMLLRPCPRSARLGFKGTVVLLLLAFVLLPMGCAREKAAPATSAQSYDFEIDHFAFATNLAAIGGFDAISIAPELIISQGLSVSVNGLPSIGRQPSQASDSEVVELALKRAFQAEGIELKAGEVKLALSANLLCVQATGERLTELKHVLIRLNGGPLRSLFNEDSGLRIISGSSSEDIGLESRSIAPATSASVDRESTSISASGKIVEKAGARPREQIVYKLNTIMLEEVNFDQPLGEVVRLLQKETRLRDPEKQGVNFMIAKGLPANIRGSDGASPQGGLPIPGKPPPEPRPPETDPRVGQVVRALREDLRASNAQSSSVGQVTQDGVPDLNSLPIKLHRSSITAMELLNEIVKASGDRIRFIVEDYAVIFVAKPKTQRLYSRFFKVGPNISYQGLGVMAAESFGSGGGFSTAPNTARISANARDFFVALGLDLTPPKALFFSDGKGLLMVHATLEELEMVEKALQELYKTPPQVMIEARLVEVRDEDVEFTGTDARMLDNPGTGLVFMNNSTNPVTLTFFGDVPPALIFTNAFNLKDPAVRLNLLKGWPHLEDQKRPLLGKTNGSFFPIAGAICVLTEGQTRELLRRYVKAPGSDVVVMPKVTTLSQRQAHFEVSDLKTILLGIRPEARTLPGISATNLERLFLTNTVPIGPAVDVLPTVEADGFSILLNALVTLNEFLGYDEPATSAQVFVGGQAQEIKPPLPRVRIRQMSGRAKVFDGQTLLLAGPKTEEIFTRADGTTELATGRPTGKQLLLLITPRIIDPAGNLRYTDADMPFRTNSIPPQHFPLPTR